MFKVDYFKTSTGKNVIRKFINKLNESDQASIFKDIALLEKYGSYLREPHSKKVAKYLWELKTSAHRCIYRSIYTKQKLIFIILHIFKKKTQKIPRKELKIAEKRLKLIKGK